MGDETTAPDLDPAELIKACRQRLDTVAANPGSDPLFDYAVWAANEAVPNLLVALEAALLAATALESKIDGFREIAEDRLNLARERQATIGQLRERITELERAGAAGYVIGWQDGDRVVIAIDDEVAFADHTETYPSVIDTYPALAEISAEDPGTDFAVYALRQVTE